MKRCQINLGRALPSPSFGQNSKEEQFFFQETFPGTSCKYPIEGSFDLIERERQSSLGRHSDINAKLVAASRVD